MKWYAGYIAEIVAFIGYIIFEWQVIENQNVEFLNFSTFIVAALVAGIVGGFLSPYHVKRISKYAASTFAIIAGIPAALFFIISGDILSSEDSDFGAVIFLIIALVLGIALVLLIVIVSVLLIAGGYIGSIFGKMVFQEEITDYQFQQGQFQQQPFQADMTVNQFQEGQTQQVPGDMVTCLDCQTTQERRNFCVNCGSELQLK